MIAVKLSVGHIIAELAWAIIAMTSEDAHFGCKICETNAFIIILMSFVVVWRIKSQEVRYFNNDKFYQPDVRHSMSVRD